VITVTEAAKERFLEIKPDRSPNGEVLRLDRARVTANGDEPKLAVYLGEPEENDQLVEHREEPLLWVSTAVSAAFDGCLMDVIETSGGMSFVIGLLDAGNDARSQEEPS
jgi:Fe-S cluster assembly iron-binding protein IscA